MSDGPEDPAFWDDWGLTAPDWPELTALERCVLVHAAEEASVREMILYFSGYRVRTPTGAAWVSLVDEPTAQPLISKFALALGRLVKAGRVEIREMPSAGSAFYDAPPVEGNRLTSILADPATWVGSPDESPIVRISLPEHQDLPRLS